MSPSSIFAILKFSHERYRDSKCTSWQSCLKVNEKTKIRCYMLTFEHATRIIFVTHPFSYKMIGNSIPHPSNYRVIKNNKGNFTHCHPVWTPVYTRRTRFWPPSRPPNFYGCGLQSTTGTCFFTFLFFWHKNTKNHEKRSRSSVSLRYQIFHEQEKTHLFKKKICDKIAIHIL